MTFLEFVRLIEKSIEENVKEIAAEKKEDEKEPPADQGIILPGVVVQESVLEHKLKLPAQDEKQKKDQKFLELFGMKTLGAYLAYLSDEKNVAAYTKSRMGHRTAISSKILEKEKDFKEVNKVFSTVFGGLAEEDLKQERKQEEQRFEKVKTELQQDIETVEEDIVGIEAARKILEDLKKKYFDLFDKPQFFHDFLLKLSSLEAEEDSKSGNLEKSILFEHEIAAIKAKKKGKILPGFFVALERSYANANGGQRIDKALAKTWFDGDIQSVKKEIGGAPVFYAQTVGVGDKHRQEDDMCLGAAKSGDLDDRQKAPVVLKKILSDYGDKVAESQQEMVEKKAKKTPGSTASIAHCSKDRILTIANAGDSRFTLFFRRADGSFGFKRLTSDARADKPFEMFRIANEQGAVRYADGVYRVKGGGNPMISRSLGDCAVRGDSEKGNKLVAHEADMSQHDIAAIAKAENASQVFLVGGTDALFELAHEKKYVAALELWHSDKKLQKSYNHNIAEYFRDLAVVFGSADNATVCVADLSQPLSEGLFVGMFDGHSDGAELSSDAANKIFNELSAEGKDVKDVKNVPETKIKNAKARDLAAPTPSLKYVKAQQLTQKAAERTCVIL